MAKQYFRRTMVEGTFEITYYSAEDEQIHKGTHIAYRTKAGKYGDFEFEDGITVVKSNLLNEEELELKLPLDEFVKACTQE